MVIETSAHLADNRFLQISRQIVTTLGWYLRKNECDRRQMTGQFARPRNLWRDIRAMTLLSVRNAPILLSILIENICVFLRFRTLTMVANLLTVMLIANLGSMVDWHLCFQVNNLPICPERSRRMLGKLARNKTFRNRLAVRS